MDNQKVYQAAMYVRLSKEDADVGSLKAESDSIANQKSLIRNFVKDKPDIQIIKEYEDDGYTGSGFDRPGFSAMLDDIRRGIIDCVIVKDLSRFGREYIDSGKYIERLFPSIGVRFIAITDNIDRKKGDDDIVIPFKNLMNDAYCRDISIKIRSTLEAKRKNGKYIGAFTPYGYLKDKNDKNRLVPDPYASNVVRDIFRMKLNGMSQKCIADHLNEQGILSPLEYKHSIGIKLQDNFKSHEKAMWDAVSVKRILENDVYIGVLTQGKRTTPNHKVKKLVERPSEEWTRLEDNHEAVISKRDFALVQKLMQLDTRIPLGKDSVYPLAGICFCGSCGAQMNKYDTIVGGKGYTYYICSNYAARRGCTAHRIPKDKLEDLTLKLLQEHIASVLDMGRILDFAKDVPFKDMEVKRLSDRREHLENDIGKMKDLRDNLYEDMKEGIVSKNEYIELRQKFAKRISDSEHELLMVDKEVENILSDNSEKYKWIDYFVEHKDITELNRLAVVQLIDKIMVYDKNNVEVVFNFDDCYQELAQAAGV